MALTAAIGLIFILLILALPVIAIVGTVISARRRPWSFELTRVISNTFTSIGARPLVFFVVMPLVWVVIGGPMLLGLGFLSTGLSGMEGGVLVIVLAIFFLLSTYVHVVLVRVSLDAMAGRRVGLGKVLAQAVAQLLVAAPLVILQWLAILISLFFLIVPALFPLTIWIAAVPAAVSEGAGLFESFGRSAQLTKGARWPILLLLLIFSIGFFMLTLLGSLLGGGLSAFDVTADSAAATTGVTGVVSVVLNLLSIVIGSAGTAAIYHELRTEKEGLASSDLEAVFA